MSSKPKICVIGAGPSGMSAIIHLTNYGNGNDVDVVCYEKQSTWGGMWNYSWRTGTDEYGEHCHNGMYRHLFINGAKEFHEYPDYTYDSHCRKPVPSFLPRQNVRDYLEGRYTQKGNLSKYIQFQTVVRNVRYDKKSDVFKVDVVNLQDNTASSEVFTHLIVATGIFNVPYQPYFQGVETFGGRILHAHDFRNASEFKGLRVLTVGSSYSADDISIQCFKYGAKSVICSWRTNKMNFKWPEGIEERPLLQRLEGNTAFFKDGSSADVDALILCTGYLYSFPFMADDIRLKSESSLYPDNLYKGTLWLGGGNNKIFYLGVQYQLYTLTMFDAQALWLRNYILRMLPDEPKSIEEMRDDIKKWITRQDTLRDWYEKIDYQTDYIADLIKETGYPREALNCRQKMKSFIDDRLKDVATYKDQCYASNFTGTVSTKPRVPYFEEMDDENWTY